MASGNLESFDEINQDAEVLSPPAAAYQVGKDQLPKYQPVEDNFVLTDGDQIAAAGNPIQPPADGLQPRGARGGRPAGGASPPGDQPPAQPPTGDTPAPTRPGDGPTPPPSTDAVDRNSQAFKDALKDKTHVDAADKIAAKIFRGDPPELTGMGRSAIEAVMRPIIDEGPVAMAALEQLVNQRIQEAARTNPALRGVEFKATHSERKVQVDQRGSTETTQNGEFSLIRKAPPGSPPGTRDEVLGEPLRLTGTKPPARSGPPQPTRRGGK